MSSTETSKIFDQLFNDIHLPPVTTLNFELQDSDVEHIGGTRFWINKGNPEYYIEGESPNNSDIILSYELCTFISKANTSFLVELILSPRNIMHYKWDMRKGEALIAYLLAHDT